MKKQHSYVYLINNKKEKMKRNISNINNGQINEKLNNDYFLSGENLKMYSNKTKDNYQNKFLIKRILDNNKGKKSKTKYNISTNYDNKEINDLDEKNYINNLNKQYSSNNKTNKNKNKSSLIDNFDKLKEMNSNVTTILCDMQKTIRPINGQYTNYNSQVNHNNNSTEKKIDTNNFIQEMGLEQNNKINIFANNKNENGKIKIKLDDLNKEQVTKLKYIYGNLKTKEYLDIDLLINDLYKYKLNEENIQKKSENISTINKNNEKTLELEKENNSLKNQKEFLINELTKSVYNYNILEQKYKNELDRVYTYINKIRFDLGEKNIDI